MRLPKEYRFGDEEVLIKRVGDGVLLLPRNNRWKNLLASLEKFGGLQIERDQGEAEERHWGDF